MKTKEGP